MISSRPADVFTTIIVTFLTPMFLSATGGNLEQARAAALYTVDAYTARNPADLLFIGQAVALGLAVVSSISLSMAENMPINMVLRLRGNAASLHRAAGQCQRAITESAQAQPRRSRLFSTAPQNEAAPAPARMADVAAGPAAVPETVRPPQPAESPATMKAAMAALAADSQRRIAEADAALKATGQPIPRRPSGPSGLSQDQHRAFAWDSMQAAQAFIAGIASLPNDPKPAGIRTTALGTTANRLFNGPDSSPAP